MEKLTADEKSALTHWSMFGSDGYPIAKVAGRWLWQFGSLKSGTSYKTKYEAVSSWEAYIDALIRREGEIAYEEAMQRQAIKEVAL